MILPNRKNLARYDAGSGLWQSTSIHPNPRYYKYRWQIYTDDSPWEDEAFFEHSPQLCTHDAMVTIEKLRFAGQTFIVYNERFPRRGQDVPFDFNSKKWKGCVFACSYDEDRDHVWNRFK